MSTDQRRRLGHVVTGAAVLLLSCAAAVIGVGIWNGQNPSPPAGSAGIPTPAATAAPIPVTAAPAPRPTPAQRAVRAARIMSRSIPTRIRIPAIGVDSRLMQLGLNPGGTLQVPPYDKNAPAGWYRGSPTPGQLGPAVILGHVDTYKAGPVVFYRLAQSRPGEKILVTRRDGTIATFTVHRVANVPKNHFPQLEVYGNTDRPELRLITCGGDWNPHTHDYTDNTIVFAHLTAAS